MSAATKTGGREATKGVTPGRMALSIGRPNLPEPDGFRWTRLESVARLESGHTPARSQSDYWGGRIPWIGIRDATGNHGRVIGGTLDSVTQQGLDNSSARLLPEGTVCLSRTASVGYVVEMGRPMATSQDFVNWVCGPNLNSAYLRYVLMLEQDSIRTRFSRGSTHQTMYYPEAKALHVLAPDRSEQDAIAEVLTALDDRLHAGDNVRFQAERLAGALYDRALIETGAVSTTIGSIAEFHNRLRVPLSSRDRDVRQGLIPYYGAAGRLDSVDDLLFNRELVLVGEDGTVMKDDGSPVVQYIWGPAWVNNHAHVLTGLGMSTELMRWAIERESVAHIVTGAVQPKISMGSLKSLAVSIPADISVVDIEVQRLAALVRARSDENERLASTRDELLPLLMSGTLRVKDAEKVVEEVV